MYICKFVYYYCNAAYLRVCIYAVPSPLLIHSQLIELVVRNTRGELVLSGLIVVYIFSSDLDVKYATAGLGFLLIYRSAKRFCQKIIEKVGWRDLQVHYALLQLDTALWFRLF